MSAQDQLYGVVPTAVADKAYFTTAKTNLRSVLVASDVIAVAAAWLIPIAISGSTPLFYAGQAFISTKALAYLGLGMLWTIFVLAGERLYRTRTCEMRITEIMRVAHAVPLVAVWSLILCRLIDEPHMARVPLFTGALFFILVNVSRMSFRNWLTSARRKGRFTRKVLLIGTSQQAVALAQHLDEKPELGFTVTGVIGSSIEAHHRDFAAPLLGSVADLETIVQSTGTTGAIIASQGMSEHQLNKALRVLLRNRVHIRMSTGLRGIDHRRLTSHSLGYEPMMYVDHVDLEGWQVVVKRIMDIVIASAALLVSLPVIFIAALAIWITDRGPILFCQNRVGRDGEEFKMLKLRSMVINAEDQLHKLAHENVRQGPLFKLKTDPRVTWIGKVIRATSIDELPQLWNVIRGDMSLVGPRPALPKEVEQFSETLLMRHNVLPGITGLWQVEARDDPDFTSYERLDVFYVENWSVLLDLSILLATAKVVIARALRAATRARRSNTRHSSGISEAIIVLD